MSTADTIVNEALEILNLNNGLLPADPRHQQVAFRVLNDLLIKYRADGIYATPRIPSTITQELNESPSAKTGLVYDVAFYSSIPLQIRELPINFDRIRNDSMRVFYVKLRPPTKQQYPETLPIGGGNEHSDTFSYRFYSQQDNADYQIYDRVNLNESQFFYADFDQDAVLKDTSVSSVLWEVLDNSGTQITNKSLLSNVAKALITFQGVGVTTFKSTATYASGEIKDFLFNVQVVSP